jgi:plasmid maintenance system antidote protein VapI
MKTIEEIRLENARALAVEGKAAFSEAIGMSAQQVNQIIGPNPSRNIGPNVARRIEQAFGMETGWLDVVHTAEQEFVNSAIRGAKKPLSDEAAELIQCVIRIDAIGEPARILFRAQMEILAVAASLTKAHDSLAIRENLDWAEEYLEERHRELEGTRNGPAKERSA